MATDKIFKKDKGIMPFKVFTICIYIFIILISAFFLESYAGTDNLSQPIKPKIERIAIDPGFGGEDFGAPSCKEGVYAKDINLAIAKKLADKIKQRLGLDIIMTRTEDEFVSLDQRTSIANKENSDLFISIHCNAHENQEMYGIETYYLNMVIDENAIELAARENATSDKNITDLQGILSDLILNMSIDESHHFANNVQGFLYQYMKGKHSFVKDRGVKQAPFYVLIGTQMPSILIEASFISNPRECERLLSDNYQNDIADGILNGLKNFIKARESEK